MGIFDKLFSKKQIKVWQGWMEGPDYLGNPKTICSSPSIDKLVQKHGVAVEVHADEHDLDACVVHVIFADGSEYIVSGNRRYIKGGPTFGYHGTGPELFKAFLNKIGFNVSKDEIAEMRTPITLRRDQQQAKSAQSKEVADLIKALGDPDEEVRFDAAVKLCEHPGEPTVKALIGALKDDNSEVRDCAAESLRVMAERGYCVIPPKPLLEAVKNKPDWWELKMCLRKLGFDSQVEEILSQAYTAAPEYDVRCIGFGCPHCGVEITRAPPSWPAHGNMVPFYAQEDLYRAGAYHIELICRGCGKTVYVVWDDDPR